VCPGPATELLLSDCVYAAGLGPGFSGRWAAAHATTSARRQIRPTSSVSTGAGKSGRSAYLEAVRFGTFRSVAISETLASSFGDIEAEPTRVAGC
jgi:hypothetical protein